MQRQAKKGKHKDTKARRKNPQRRFSPLSKLLSLVPSCPRGSSETWFNRLVSFGVIRGCRRDSIDRLVARDARCAVPRSLASPLGRLLAADHRLGRRHGGADSVGRFRRPAEPAEPAGQARRFAEDHAAVSERQRSQPVVHDPLAGRVWHVRDRSRDLRAGDAAGGGCVPVPPGAEGLDYPPPAECPVEDALWDTIDKVRHRNRDGELRFYSSKPPLLATMLAGEYWLIYHLTGATLEERPHEIARFMLITSTCCRWC